MKKVLLIIVLLLVVSSGLSGCNKETEKQRYRVKVVQHLEDNTYIVEKYGYTIGGIYYLNSSRELKIDEIVYVIQIGDYEVMLFENFIDKD